MKSFIVLSHLVFLILFCSPNKIKAETTMDTYMNDFYSKSNKASQILKEIETTLKEGSREKVCTRQKEAARLGLLANKSLIKAFELKGSEPPLKSINANNKRWESLLNNC